MAATRVPSWTASRVTLQGSRLALASSCSARCANVGLQAPRIFRKGRSDTEFGFEHGRNIDFGEDAGSLFSEGGTDGRLGRGDKHGDYLSICGGDGVENNLRRAPPAR